MNELEPMIFPEDTEIPDPIVCLDVIAHGNLKVFSMDIKGILAVASTLEVETQLIVKGPANIGGFFRGNNCIAKFNSSCKIGKNIEGGRIEINGVLEAESVTRDMPRAFLAYEELLDDWRGTVARLAIDLDLAWPRYSATAEVEIDRFLDVRHRHHNICHDIEYRLAGCYELHRQILC